MVMRVTRTVPSEHILNLSLGVSNVINGTRWEIKGSLWSQAQLNCYSDSENDDEVGKIQIQLINEFSIFQISYSLLHKRWSNFGENHLGQK